MKASTISRWHYPLALGVFAAVLIIDYNAPTGFVPFIFYFLPVMVGLFDRHPERPLILAAIATILLPVGYHLSPEGAIPILGKANRYIGLVIVWIIAFLVRRVVLTNLETEKTDWVKSALNQMSLRLRGERPLQDLGVELLKGLVVFSNCKVALLYEHREARGDLEFLAGHAVPPERPAKHIPLGEGLLGQAARDGEIIEISPLPEGHIKLSSGLGESQPQYLLVLPLKVDEEVIAVVELAFAQKPEEKIISFLRQVGELAAVALKSGQYKSRLAKLLEQSQQLTEELQAQQEELRVSNEELEQQSRALKESATRLENQQAELEQTNQQLEGQAKILETQKAKMDEKNKELLTIKYELEEKALALSSSGKYKSEFLANMSHELRTPLNSSLILAKLLADNKDGNLNEEQVKYAQIIHQSGNDLLNLINDVLDLAKVEAGKLVIHPENLRIDNVAETLKITFSPQAEIKHLKLFLELEKDLPETMITDRQRLDQILKNFLSNALKFTEKGHVKIKVGRSPRGVRFSVIDTGIGISEGQQQAIFEAFRQADGTTNRKFGGTGLGLSISRELASLLGGEISVTSTPGEGSTFTLDLPLEFKLRTQIEEKVDLTPAQAPPPEPPTQEEKPFAAPGAVQRPETAFSFKDDRNNAQAFERLMLIIEDDETFAKILFDLAREMDFGALVASTADEGISLARHHVPHAIVLDIRLPDHNGLVVLDQLKMTPKTRHIPVHVMSSSDFSRSALEMGAAGYMMKPVKRDDLQTAFSNLASVTNQKMKHVLVIEDNDIQRQHVVELISDPSVKVDSVSTASEALERLAVNTYDCMVMDLSLPDLSGHELLAKLSSESSRYSFPPVIVYTARDLTQEEEEKLRLYSGSIIIKGAKSPERLLSEVTLFLHRVENELPLERQKMLSEFRSREKNLENRKILVVDDDVRNIFALTSALENYGAHIVVARNGREALERLQETSDIDLVLMDIMMPEMDGYEAMTRIRAEQKWKDISIIALTAKAMKDDKERCLAVGANDYLPKPIDMDKLLSLIRVWLPTKRSFNF